ncbi:hypothetical protein ACW0JT_19030 [Arthrobacter sp. SA17]
MSSDLAEAPVAARPRHGRRVGVNPLAVVAAIIIAGISLLVILAPWVAPYDPLKQDLTAILELPSPHTGWAPTPSAATHFRGSCLEASRPCPAR